jgi:hypothetical protein
MPLAFVCSDCNARAKYVSKSFYTRVEQIKSIPPQSQVAMSRALMDLYSCQVLLIVGCLTGDLLIPKHLVLTATV